MTDSGIKLITISRASIAAGNLTAVVEMLNKLSSTADQCMLYRQRIGIYIGGYENEQQNIWEIAEVRAFFNDLNAVWPYWGWFLNPRFDLPFVTLTLCLLCPGREEADRWVSDLSAVQFQCADMVAAMADLAARHGLSQDLLDDTKARFSDSVEQAYCQNKQRPLLDDDPYVAIVIDCDESEEMISLPKDEGERLKRLQDLVEGHIEVIPLGCGRVMVINSDGKLLPHPRVNVTATMIASVRGSIMSDDHITGRAIVLHEEALK